MLIDSSYFIGKRNVPNTSYGDVGSIIDNFINSRQPEYLTKLLGYGLFKPFMAAITQPVTAGQTTAIPQRYLDILHGVDFIGLNGQLKRWNGLTGISTEPQIESPITDYVYYYWLFEQHTLTTGLGQVRPATENSARVSAKYKAVETWNDMVDKSILLYEYLKINIAVYPEYQFYVTDRKLNNLLTKINPFY